MWSIFKICWYTVIPGMHQKHSLLMVFILMYGICKIKLLFSLNFLLTAILEYSIIQRSVCASCFHSWEHVFSCIECRLHLEQIFMIIQCPKHSLFKPLVVSVTKIYVEEYIELLISYTQYLYWVLDTNAVWNICFLDNSMYSIFVFSCWVWMYH